VDNEIKIPVSDSILNTVSRLDRARGRWSVFAGVGDERLRSLEAGATIRSVGSSCRLGGIRVTDAEVAELLGGGSPAIEDAAEVAGYATALGARLPSMGQVLTTDDIRNWHALVLGAPVDRATPSPWRSKPVHREAFDAQGRATGWVLSTLPPRMVEEKTEDLVTWLEIELRNGVRHPVLAIGTFLMYLLAISPFERGNGRLTRVLGGLLLRRAGYTSMPYASLEAEIEQRRDDYYEAQYLSQARLWTADPVLAPWLTFFLEVLEARELRLEAKLAVEREAESFPPLQRAIVDTVREHGSVGAALLLRATGANRNTLKDNLRRLVERGVLERTGQRRGTRYNLAHGPGAPAPVAGIADA
jgi:Fic family protein